MSTHLSTGIITGFSAPVKSVEKINIEGKMPEEAFGQAIVDNLDLFECAIREGEYTWNLKPEILEQNLKSFLEQYYIDFYRCSHEPKHKRDLLQVFRFLNTRPSVNEVTQYLQESYTNVFQGDHYYGLYISFGDEPISYHLNTIKLSQEGQVMFEEVYDHLSFFQRSLRQLYKRNPLGNCLFVEVS